MVCPLLFCRAVCGELLVLQGCVRGAGVGNGVGGHCMLPSQVGGVGGGRQGVGRGLKSLWVTVLQGTSAIAPVLSVSGEACCTAPEAAVVVSGGCMTLWMGW
jgi:hypothetical protein